MKNKRLLLGSGLLTLAVAGVLVCEVRACAEDESETIVPDVQKQTGRPSVSKNVARQNDQPWNDFDREIFLDNLREAPKFDPRLGKLCGEELVNEGDEDKMGVGECHLGSYILKSGQIVCDGLQLPQTEVCDGKDNDCDGTTDNDSDEPCSDPYYPLKGECRQGRYECRNGAIDRSNCVSQVKPEFGRCDGLDNDCDGVPEEKRDLDSEFIDGVAVAHAAGLYFYVDLKCRIVWPDQGYERAHHFSHGRALVQKLDFSYNIINKNGQEMCEKQLFDYTASTNMIMDYFPLLVRKIDEKKYYFINDACQNPFPWLQYADVWPFTCDRARLLDERHWYFFITTTGAEAFPGRRFASASDFSHNHYSYTIPRSNEDCSARVCTDENESSCFFIDIYGQRIINE